jgi:hypothetical protein
MISAIVFHHATLMDCTGRLRQREEYCRVMACELGTTWGV